MKEFRRTVVDALVDQGQKLRLRWAFRLNVVPALVDPFPPVAMAVGSCSITVTDLLLGRLSKTNCAVNIGKSLFPWREGSGNLLLHRKTFQPDVVAAVVDHSHRLAMEMGIAPTTSQGQVSSSYTWILGWSLQQVVDEVGRESSFTYA
jgi:hypothetical protein